MFADFPLDIKNDNMFYLYFKIIVCIAGSLIATLGILVSMISPNVYMLVITYGVIGGIGISLVYVPTMVSRSHYFTTKRALATGKIIVL